MRMHQRFSNETRDQTNNDIPNEMKHDFLLLNPTISKIELQKYQTGTAEAMQKLGWDPVFDARRALHNWRFSEPIISVTFVTCRSASLLPWMLLLAFLSNRSIRLFPMTIDNLRQVPLFESLDDDAARELCKLLETLDCEADKVLFRAGDAGDAMYVIERGKVRICVQATNGHELTLAELGRGDFFGEMALLLDGQRRSANAVGAEESRLAVLSRGHILFFILRNSNGRLEMLTARAKRLRRTDDLLRHSTTRNVNIDEAAQLTLADLATDSIAEFGVSWKCISLSTVFF